MKIILLGATGMVGQGVLTECLRDPRVDSVLALGRSPSGRQHPKLQELVHADLYDLSAIENRLRGYDACFYCLGVSSVGMAETEYTRVTYDMTLAVATALTGIEPGMTFIYVTGAGTDSSEQGRSMWARVKGRTENALLRLPFKAVYLFRPGGIQPLHGAQPRVGWIRAIYAATAPVLSLAVRYAPGAVTTTERVGRAMINAAASGMPSRIFESSDINREGRRD
ncbi:MAG: NAD-dependent epimerase/dehydratase family protein [Pseudoxanthomonas sp.]